jgi:hypothetical protein
MPLVAFNKRHFEKDTMEKRVLENKFLKLEYRTDALRIMGLTPTGKNNLFVELDDSASVPTPFGRFYFRGGHRLWHAPEAMPRTYIPDDELMVTSLPDGCILETKTEPGTAIRKRIEIRLASDKPSVTLIHTLINDGLWSVELAPWAITQFRLGGTAILPLPTGNVDEAGLLHNRQFSLWPYTRISDPRVKLGDEFILFKADALLPPFKIGYFNSHGWMAYWLDGRLFRKTFDTHAGLTHPDNNCNAEMYCNNQFVELETLGPLLTIAPGSQVSHIETWEVFDTPDVLPEKFRDELMGA